MRQFLQCQYDSFHAHYCTIECKITYKCKKPFDARYGCDSTITIPIVIIA